MEETINGTGLSGIHLGRCSQLRERCVPKLFDTSKTSEKCLFSNSSDPRDTSQGRCDRPSSSHLLMVSNRKTMGLIADAIEEMDKRRVFCKNEGFLKVRMEDLFPRFY